MIKNKRKQSISVDQSILLFDGVCNLCNGLVLFIIKRDPDERFLFASLQSDPAQHLLRRFHFNKNYFDSLVLIQGNKVYTRSTAVLHLLKGLGGFWRFLYGFIVIPKPIRDSVYDKVAKNRYKWFGQKEKCMIPTTELKKRYL